MEENYLQKNDTYFNKIRYDIVKLISGNNLKILEIGAGHCDTLVYLKEKKIAKEVVAVELIRKFGSNQDSVNLDKLIICKIEDLNINEYKNYFDIIIFADVLEHLIEPWDVLENSKKMLKDNGKIIVSLPNIRFYESFISIILKGRFPYSDQGLFDITHMRFFCKNDMNIMFSKLNFFIEKQYPIFKLANKIGRAYILNFITFGLFEEFLSLQYVTVLKK
jgi:2-polyprenyl-3-methyl-5-hydroxy-6-metoxy-1,4-benzoquinol methylase